MIASTFRSGSFLLYMSYFSFRPYAEPFMTLDYFGTEPPLLTAKRSHHYSSYDLWRRCAVTYYARINICKFI